ncbi:acetolactate synthase [Virgisporangium ochraceum]
MLAALRAYGVTEVFTLSGGHLFPLYDALHTTGVRLLDVRHEQSAVFAAEAVAKLQRRPAVAALTAGPGVTNGISGITSAHFNGSPVVVVGGRAPQFRWGAGSLQEIDHLPIVRPVTKHAETIMSTAQTPEVIHRAVAAAIAPHRGPVFVDAPLEVIFDKAEAVIGAAHAVTPQEADPDELARAAALLARAERPILIAGSDVYTGDAVAALREAEEALQVPVFANGMGRGALPPGHPLAFARARKAAMTGADVVCVVGTPLDFRLGFGDYGEAQVIHIVDAESQKANHAKTAAAPVGDLRLILTALAQTASKHDDWIAKLREVEDAARAKEVDALSADTDPIKPSRVYGALRNVLDADAVTIGDGGDFVSYAGKYLEPGVPGAWLDPGPYGCLGTGMGYAMGARVTYPDRQICVLMGDGAAGFSLMDVESLVRQNLPVVIVVGNNGIWGLEKHPMQALYGYDVAADLQPGLRYDKVVEAMGGAGETVSRAGDLEPALNRAFASGVPYLVNVLTDPADMYPRSANLA